jgi:hypothetical protein
MAPLDRICNHYVAFLVNVPSAGILLPPGVVQPFFLRFQRDDLHAMAFFEGHPRYEAVEAMVTRREDGGHSIRAILTGHDQNQIDHVNDEALLAQMRGAQRRICRRPIAFQAEARGRGMHVAVEFESLAGEAVRLDLTTVGPAVAAGAGLSDPGQHSAASSLPLMWRDASALAGPKTAVIIDGIAYPCPLKYSTPALAAHEGYYTEGHSMGALRAGTVHLLLVKEPSRVEAGAEWIFRRDGPALRYRVASMGADGQLRICGPHRETIIARLIDGRLRVSQIKASGERDGEDGLSLDLAGPGVFALSMPTAPHLVDGIVRTEAVAAGLVVTLTPRRPAWAAKRPVHVEISRRGDRFTFVTTIGDGGGAAARASNI